MGYRMENILEWIKDNRKSTIYIGTAILVVILIISILLIRCGIKKEDSKFIQYSDNKNLEYKVILKENEYYKDSYMEKGNQYIANLINYVHADFKYNFNLNDTYDYKYKIIGTVDVVDEKTNKTIYTVSEDLLMEKNGRSEGNLDIDEAIDVEYNKYNDKIKQFVATYDLKNVTCKLSLNLNLGVTGVTKQFSKQDFTVMRLDIPLANNTISIDTGYNVSDNNNVIELQNKESDNIVFSKIGIVLLVIDVIVSGLFIIFMKKTETDVDRYNGELRKIINNYDSYISKVEDDFDMRGYQILKVQKFADLLEIRDTMQLPIIMLENKEQLVTYFAIPTPNNILYFFSISVTQYILSSGKSVANRKEMRTKDEQKV